MIKTFKKASENLQDIFDKSFNIQTEFHSLINSMFKATLKGKVFDNLIIKFVLLKKYQLIDQPFSDKSQDDPFQKEINEEYTFHIKVLSNISHKKIHHLQFLFLRLFTFYLKSDVSIIKSITNKKKFSKTYKFKHDKTFLQLNNLQFNEINSFLKAKISSFELKKERYNKRKLGQNRFVCKDMYVYTNSFTSASLKMLISNILKIKVDLSHEKMYNNTDFFND